MPAGVGVDAAVAPRDAPVGGGDGLRDPALARRQRGAGGIVEALVVRAPAVASEERRRAQHAAPAGVGRALRVMEAARVTDRVPPRGALGERAGRALGRTGGTRGPMVFRGARRP